MNINEAIEEFEFFHEGNYITSNMKEAKDIVLKELKKRDKYKFYYEATEQQRRADIEVIDKLKGSCLRKNKMIDLMLEELTACEIEMKCSECTHECEKDCDSLYQCNKEYFEERCK